MLSFTRYTLFEEIPEKLLPGIIKIRIEGEEDYNYPLDVTTTDEETELNAMKVPPHPDSRIITIVGHHDDHVVALGTLRLNIGSHNRNNASIMVRVLSSERRKGYGWAILEKLVQEIPEEVDILFFQILPQYREFYEYIEKYPVKLGMIERKSASDLRKFNLPEVRSKAAELRRNAEEQGYEFIKIRDFEFPEEFNLNAYMKVLEQIWNDMPSEDLSFEDERINERHFEVMKERIKASGTHNWLIVCIEKETGYPVGMTDIFFDYRFPELLYQGDTGVIREHRGKRLGLTLKYLMLEEILSDKKLKDAKYIQTHNAHSNEPMIRINNELGYEEVALLREYEIRKDDLFKILRN
ncbi:MAG: hypothetical protein D6732_01250 [Methanobacteriota archaeon]|nr:MAG: hypothetical protein D6732_01250 [Euryarchaeota archaeon]